MAALVEGDQQQVRSEMRKHRLKILSTARDAVEKDEGGTGTGSLKIAELGEGGGLTLDEVHPYRGYRNFIGLLETFRELVYGYTSTTT